MACDVDELDINPFFSALQTKFSDLYNRAQEKCYTICIPQSTSIHPSAINRDFAETHILRPSPYFKGELLTTHGNHWHKTVSLDENGQTLTTVEGFPTKLTVRIVSEELAYNKEYKQYRILILNQSLDPKFQCKTSGVENACGQKRLVQCITLAECRQFLHSIPAFSKVLQKVDSAVKLFNSNYMVLPDYLKDAAFRLADISTEGVEGCKKCVERNLAADIQWTDALVTAMESYVMGQVQPKVMMVVKQLCAGADSSVQRKCLQQLRTVSGEALGIQPHFSCPLPQPGKELSKLSQLKTPREKLHCLKAVIDAVTTTIAAHLARDNPPHLALVADNPSLTSDDLIPILVSVVGQSQSQHIQSELVYMETFTWASSAKDKDDLSYCLVTFKAAVQYILDTDFSDLPQQNACRRQVSVDKLPAAMDRLSIANGSGARGDKTPSPCISPTPFLPTRGSASPTFHRLERHMSQRSSKTLELEPSVAGPLEKEKKVTSIFGAKYDVPSALEMASRSQTSPQLGDFLSSLQDDFMDTPYGKLT